MAYVHIARIVSARWLVGSNLGATTTKPTRTPSWTILVRRAGGRIVSCELGRTRADRRTEYAVGDEANVEQGHEEPRQPEEAVSHKSVAASMPLASRRYLK